MENLENKENIKVYLISHFDEEIILVNDKLNKYRQGFYRLQKNFQKNMALLLLMVKKSQANWNARVQ